MKKQIIQLAMAYMMMLMSPMMAQNVGISPTGAPPDNSAGLDVNFTNKGLLIPRVSLTSITDVVTIPSPANSLVVYNTNAAMTNGNGVGFYYWNGSRWVYMASPANGPGNSGQVLVSQGAGNAPQWAPYWYLWQVDHFNSNNALGWSGAGMTQCGTQWLLGGYGQCGNGCTMSKTFTGLPPHSQVMIDIQWWSIDSWDQVSGGAGVDTGLVVLVDGIRAGFQTPYAPMPSGANVRSSNASICGSASWVDQGPQFFRVVLPHTASTMTIQLPCRVNQDATDESCALQGVYIWLKP